MRYIIKYLVIGLAYISAFIAAFAAFIGVVGLLLLCHAYNTELVLSRIWQSGGVFVGCIILGCILDYIGRDLL